MSQTKTPILLVALFGLGILGAFWQSTAAQNSPSESPAAASPEMADVAVLGGEDRFLTHISTDKAIYREGETVFVRGTLLHYATHRPLPPDQQAQAAIEIRGPKGDVVAAGHAVTEDSVLGFQWTVPEGQAGGEYTIKITYPFFGHTPAERQFDIRAYRAPRLKTQIKFLRDGYGPGDEVAATLHVERAEGGIPSGASVTVIARVDGAEAFRGAATVDQAGDCLARFSLPLEIARGEGTLAMTIEDGGVVETASKTIPILLQTVDLSLYPEGGELVAGLPCRVYFEAFTPANKPADLAGVVVDDQGKQAATFRSEHEGRGRFSLLPEAGRQYSLKITEPTGIHTSYPLPAVKRTGAVLRSDENVFAADAPISLHVGTSLKGEDAVVTLAKCEQVLARRVLRAEELPAGQLKQIDLVVDKDAPDGVLIATIWDSEGKPLAERLVFRKSIHQLKLRLSADASSYVPGGMARITVTATDELGQPVDAVVGMAVTDDSVVEMIERREQAPQLPVMVLLENEVQELADAHVYLDEENPLAPLAVDLLLGTQGWRRFALVNLESFLAEHGDAGRRAVALRLATHREMRRGGAMFGGMGMPEGMEFDAFRGVMQKGAAADDFGMVEDGPALPAPGMAGGEPMAAPADSDEPAASELPLGENAVENAPVDALQDEMPFKAELAQKLAIPAEPGQPVGGREFEERQQLREALEMNAEAELPVLADLDMAEAFAARDDFVPVRIYAHQLRAGRKPGQRSDFTETLFWHAGLRTGRQGEASIEFALNDSVSSFRVSADAFDAAGGLGGESIKIESVEPFYLEPKLPLEVTMGDVVRSPLAIVNATDVRMDNTQVQVEAHASQKIRSTIPAFRLQPYQRVRRMLNVKVGKYNGRVDLTVSGSAGPYGDQVTRSMLVRPLGFPTETGAAGLIDTGDTVSHEISIADDLVPKSLNSRIVVYPTPLASMTEALERLIREPYGCFEQTSSTVYPLVMAQQYFMSHQGVDPSLIERSSQILETGYNRLIGFESPSGGFEWFGGDPGHDALTAYGLMEFTDMAQVRHVDPAMLDRTRDWLLTQRDGKGGFLRKTHTLHTWLAEPELAFSYDTWALLEAGIDADLTKEVEWVREAAERTDNTYVTALAANVLAMGGDVEGANHMLDRLAGKQADEGSLDGATQSVVGSGGEALQIETTALAVLAWLKNPRYVANVERSIKYLAESCKAGRFGSTQSTVLALRAIVEYDRSRAKPKAPGTLLLVIDGQEVGQPVSFTADRQGAIELPDAAAQLTPGRHQIQIRMDGGGQMPYTIAADYYRLKPDSSDACKLHLEASLRDQSVEEGGITEASVTVINRTGEKLPTPVALIGIPGGLEVRHDQLKELVEEGKIAAYEVMGREVVLYWRALEAEQRVDLPLSLVAAIPGDYTGPASRAYEYYTDEHKQWVDGMHVTIAPKRQ